MVSQGCPRASSPSSIEERWDQGKGAVYDELYTPNYIHHDPTFFNIRTHEDCKRGVIETRSAFPDFHLTIEDLIAEGEQVITRWTMRGTNIGDLVTLMHVPATGKQVTITGITVVRFAGGKTVEDWHLGDHLGMFQQLGLIPAPQLVGE